MASIVDKPKESNQRDLLEIEKYTNGLIEFIGSSSTPITIGVQGEWGSGKTSLLNTIREDLCEIPESKHYAVWINTWEYSLLSNPDETLIKIIVGLIEQIGKITKKSSEDSFKKVSALGKLLLSRATSAGGVLGVVAGVASDTLEVTDNNGTDNNNTIKELRDSLQIVIDKAIESSGKDSFIFFIDDLDRLDPAVAVSILELIKNLFDLKNCIFVLAIDYGVVVKGLQSKFGKMTEENEWEFRAFFDKIIQLPFSMPIASYNISKYLQSLLVSVKYFDQNDFKDEATLSKISEIVSLSVGTNPRTLKRLANSVSLIEIIRGNQPITTEERVIEFALICIQIIYPSIYSLITREPDFINWDDRVVYSVVKNKKIDTQDIEAVKETDEFDEEWEQNLWKICQISSFLKERAFLLSKLLNLIKDNMPEIEGEEMEETIERLLRMSSVTSVSTESVINKEKKQRIRYQGWNEYEKALEARRIPDKIIDYTKTVIEYINSLFDKNDITITYAPTSVNYKNPHARSRKKVFIWITIQKRKVILGIFINDEKVISIIAGNYPDALVRRDGWVDFTLSNQSLSTIENYKKLILLAHKGMETN